MLNLSPEESRQVFLEWKQHPVTQEVLEILAKRIQEHQALWASGNLDSSFSAEYIARNSAAKGYVNACQDVLNISFEDITSE